MYKRILLKLSGEQLTGKYDVGLDPAVGEYFAEEVKKVVEAGAQTILVVGGGNVVRGAQFATNGIKRVTADQMGMLATMINALALTDIFEAHGIKTRCLSSIYAEQVAEPFVNRLANKHLEKGRVVIVAGGIGRPYVTTDTAAVALGLELGCNVVLKATKVDAIYDKDPVNNSDARPFTHLDYQRAVGDDAIKVMDKAAMGLAMEYRLPIVAFNAMGADNLLKVVQGQAIGTTISDQTSNDLPGVTN